MALFRGTLHVATETKTETPTQTSEIKVLDYSSQKPEDAEKAVKRFLQTRVMVMINLKHFKIYYLISDMF